ncbi:hypothetical protein F5876DRAFT_67910 [Lentinula aff. lateritia]|uniref:Uncharacterized protein n=1 Tax=Lentinula aff. lateritia TaxID=2804960 RepID=A0ACC1TSV1_9AGAR|nr:hypothetical protein F5876DRAFT_67910 [Lentinula aff. lateritia]
MSRYALATREAEETHAFVVFDVLQFTALALVSATYLSALFSAKLQRLKTCVAAAGLAFIVELYLRLFTTLTSRKLDKRLITATGISKQHTVQRNTQQMFCHINDNLPTTVTGVTVVALLVLMILLELSSGIYGGVANVAAFFHLHFPLSVALVFGTQENNQDIVQVYKFWKKRGLPAGSPQPNIDGESVEVYYDAERVHP